LRQYHQAIYVFRDKKPVKEEIETSLTIFDKEKDGQVDVHELKNILMNMGDIVTQSEFDSVFSELKAHKGRVKMNELVDLLMIQPQ
jgi:Ca2+-binding EF-hand superfamily protein